jgi:DNA-binding NarL/FixJ family response regulator
VSSHGELSDLLATPPVAEFDSIGKDASPRLFILDTYFLPLEISKLTRQLLVRYPGSKFVALLPPNSGDKDILRLLYLGIEGPVRISDNLEEELAAAVSSVLAGGLWAPRGVLGEYVQQTNWLRSEQFLSRFSLTPRESQILQLALRRFSNNEMAAALGISQRTVKFHISNIFSKVQVDDRKSLLATLSATLAEPV